jgi:hypothetical protein
MEKGLDCEYRRLMMLTVLCILYSFGQDSTLHFVAIGILEPYQFVIV